MNRLFPLALLFLLHGSLAYSQARSFTPTRYDINRLSTRVQIAFGARPPNLYVLTYGTNMGSGECATFIYADLLGYKFNMIDYYELQYNAHKKACGYQHINKVDAFLGEITRLTLEDPTAIVFVLDTDVILQLPAEVLMDRFLNKYLNRGMPEEGMMFAATEAFCYPRGPYCNDYWHKFLPKSMTDQKELFEMFERAVFMNGGSILGHATYYRDFFRATLSKKVSNIQNKTSLFRWDNGSKESQKTFAEDDQHLLAYGMMEAGKNVERDFAGEFFVCPTGAKWRHYTWLPTFGLWTKWTHLVNSTRFMEFYEDKDKFAAMTRVLTPDTACSNNWPSPRIQMLAKRNAGNPNTGQTAEDLTNFVKDFLIEAVRQYPETPVVFHFNGYSPKHHHGYLYKRWVQSSYHALRAVYEYASTGVWPYEVETTPQGPDGPFIKACPGVTDLEEIPYVPKNAVIRVGTKLGGIDLDLQSVCVSRPMKLSVHHIHLRTIHLTHQRVSAFS